MSIQEQIIAVLRSRKFWMLLVSVAGVAAAYSTGQIDGWQAVQGLIYAGAAFSLGVALEDAGAKSSNGHG